VLDYSSAIHGIGDALEQGQQRKCCRQVLTVVPFEGVHRVVRHICIVPHLCLLLSVVIFTSLLVITITQRLCTGGKVQRCVNSSEAGSDHCPSTSSTTPPIRTRSLPIKICYNMTINLGVNSTYVGVMPELVILSLHCVAYTALCARLSYCGTFATFFAYEC
jgi:hypothetical protein